MWENTWKYKNNEGNYVTGWQQINNFWYYFDNAGVMLRGWQYIEGKWFYLRDFKETINDVEYPEGSMLTGWKLSTDTKKWYYLNEYRNEDFNGQVLETGECLTACEYNINGKMYKFDYNGAWIPQQAVNISDELIEFSKSFEGYTSVWENIGDGELTIGYGTATSSNTGRAVYRSGIKKCTKEQATAWFKQEMQECTDTIKAWANDNNVTLDQQKLDSLSDVLYNMGFTNFKKFHIDAIAKGVRANVWDNWNVCTTDAYGHKYPGLVTRRAGEYKIFSCGDYSTRP